MSLIEITSREDLEKAVAGNGPLLVQYSATWCGPCAVLRRHVEALADKVDFPVAIFYIDTADGGQDVAIEAGIMSVPVVSLYLSGARTDLKGRNVMALEKEIAQTLGG